MTHKQIETKTYPFYGYAPGNYLNTCSCCKKDMYNVDKLCFVCIECAIKLSQSDFDQLKERVKELEEGLKTFSENFSLYMPKRGMTNDIYITAVWHSHNTAKQLLTKKQ